MFKIALKLMCLFSFCFLASCVIQSENGGSDKDSNSKPLKNMLKESEIINHIRQAIKPDFKSWVVFANGTYIINSDSSNKNFKEKALEIMREYGPVHGGSPAGDMTITKLTLTEGWVVGGHYYGMYTYVHPSELEKKDVADIDVGFFGRKKRDKDGRELRIIHVNE